MEQSNVELKKYNVIYQVYLSAEGDPQYTAAAAWSDVAAKGGSGSRDDKKKHPRTNPPSPSSSILPVHITSFPLKFSASQQAWPKQQQEFAFVSTASDFCTFKQSSSSSKDIFPPHRGFYNVSRQEAEKMLETNPEFGSIILRPSSRANCYGLTLRQLTTRSNSILINSYFVAKCSVNGWWFCQLTLHYTVLQWTCHEELQSHWNKIRFCHWTWLTGTFQSFLITMLLNLIKHFQCLTLEDGLDFFFYRSKCHL